MKYSLTFTIVMISACLGAQKEAPEDEQISSFAPPEGPWNFNISFSEDSCGFFSEEENMDTEITLLNTGIGEFSATINGLGQDIESSVLHCSFSGPDFTCEPSITEIEIPPASIIYQELNLSGTFSHTDRFTGSIQISISCEGDDCASLAEVGFTLPCLTSGGVEGIFVEDFGADTEV